MTSLAFTDPRALSLSDWLAATPHDRESALIHCANGLLERSVALGKSPSPFPTTEAEWARIDATLQCLLFWTGATQESRDVAIAAIGEAWDIQMWSRQRWTESMQRDVQVAQRAMGVAA